MVKMYQDVLGKKHFNFPQRAWEQKWIKYFCVEYSVEYIGMLQTYTDIF